MHFKGKLMNQTWENDKKTNFRPDCGLFGQNLGHQNFVLWILLLVDVRDCCKLSFYAISGKTYDPNSRKWQRTSIWAWFRPIKWWRTSIWDWFRLIRPKFVLPFFFFFFLSSKIWLCQSLDTVHVHLSSCKISEKPNDLILRKFSDGRTDRWTDGWEWFHRMLSDWHRVSKIRSSYVNAHGMNQYDCTLELKELWSDACVLFWFFLFCLVIDFWRREKTLVTARNTRCTCQNIQISIAGGGRKLLGYLF